MEQLIHSGVAHDDNPPGRGSGRYAWGTGDTPHQHQSGLGVEVDKMKKQGLKESEIAKILLGDRAKIQDLRAEITLEKNAAKKANIQKAIKLYDETKNVSEVGRRMGLNESSVRSLLNPALAERRDRYTATAEMLKEAVKKQGGMIDIGKYSELYLGVPAYTKDVAVSMLVKEGYLKTWTKVKQLGTGHETTITVLAAPDISWSDVQKNKDNIKGIKTFTPDEGKTWWTPEFPSSIDSKRIYVRYDEDGGRERDGVIELRRGVEDLSLGGSQYAQVRIAVDGSHYMKGMAVYSDDIPKGYDVIYNTNKSKGTPLIGEDKNHEVLKRMKINPDTGEVDRDNPFGALIKSPKEKDGVVMAGGQRHYLDKDGNDRLSPINKLQDEGDWDSWSRKLSSQFLSKQPLKLIKQQINLSIADKKAEFDEILSLTNPVIKKKMLEDFANSCDANASDLSVNGFKDQSYQVLLPIPGLKNNEVYAPNFKDGDTVALVRYPHGGIFEIPVLKVNNRAAAAKKIFHEAPHDAIGININVADQLSGADFDGDTSLIFPVASNNLKISYSPPLEGLKGFDGKSLYKLPDDAPGIKPKRKQTEMGIVTNLITDMSIAKGTSEKDICKAVKHSMVVIDSEKHHLDYKRSEKDNDIIELKKKYQGVNPKTGAPSGASTVISQAGSSIRIPTRKEINDPKKMTPAEYERWKKGYVIYHNKNEMIKKRIDDPKKMTPEELALYNAGKKVYRVTNKPRTIEVTKMSMVDDARDLVRDKTNEKEMAYADYANELKAMANSARREYRSIKPTKISQAAKKTYAKEVEELKRKLRMAELNNPRERQAQSIGNAILKVRLEEHPDLDYEHKKREEALALAKGRAMVGAKKEKIVITDKEWEAIQANAISTDKLTRIVNNSDLDILKEKAMPRNTIGTLSVAQLNKIRVMKASGMYTQSDIAEAVGVSISTVAKAIRGELD